MANLGGIALAPWWVLDARSLSLSDGDPVASWIPTIGTGTMAQATPGVKPIYTADCGDGLPGVLFDGVDDFMSVVQTLTGFGSSFAAFVVFKPTDPYPSGSQVTPFGIGSTTYIGVHRTEYLMGGLTSVTGTTLAWADLRAHFTNQVLYTAWDGTTYRYGAGPVTGSKTPAGGTAAPAGTTFIGKVGSSFAKGYVRQIVVYNTTALSAADIAAVKAELETLWKINQWPNIGIEGTSLEAPTLNTYAWPVGLSGRLGVKYSGMVNIAVGGSKIADYQTRKATMLALKQSGQPMIAIVGAPTNDLATNNEFTAAAAYANYIAYLADLIAAGIKVIACTVTSRTVGSAGTGTQFPQKLIDFNVLLAGDTSKYHGLIDFQADSRLSDSTNATYKNADGTHDVDAGKQVRAELAEPVVNNVWTLATAPSSGSPATIFGAFGFGYGF